ncbi:MAG: tripartite tricarboxylate transporter substrate binding protein, partial [Nitrospinota bacterium]
DRTARALAVSLEKVLGQRVGVVNRTGGGGVVGHSATATAKPNGYTLGMITIEITMMHWLRLTDLSYRDYEPIALLINNPAGITVRADAPWKTYKELMEYIRANPGKLTASGTAAGGVWDLARIGWLKGEGLDTNAVRWVPSTGASAALAELAAGGVDICTCSPLEALPLIEGGKARSLAVMSDKRLKALPDVPTLKELGIDFSIGGWAGIAAPRGTPEEVLQVLYDAVTKAVNSPEFTQFIENSGFGADFRVGSAFHDFLALQDTVNGQLLRAAGLAP